MDQEWTWTGSGPELDNKTYIKQNIMRCRYNEAACQTLTN